MKVQYCDNPNKFEYLGNNKFLYNYEVKRVEIETIDPSVKTIRYNCRQIRFNTPVSANDITELVN